MKKIPTALLTILFLFCSCHHTSWSVLPIKVTQSTGGRIIITFTEQVPEDLDKITVTVKDTLIARFDFLDTVRAGTELVIDHPINAGEHYYIIGFPPPGNSHYFYFGRGYFVIDPGTKKLKLGDTTNMDY